MVTDENISDESLLSSSSTQVEEVSYKSPGQKKKKVVTFKCGNWENIQFNVYVLVERKKQAFNRKFREWTNWLLKLILNLHVPSFLIF